MFVVKFAMNRRCNANIHVENSLIIMWISLTIRETRRH